MNIKGKNKKKTTNSRYRKISLIQSWPAILETISNSNKPLLSRIKRVDIRAINKNSIILARMRKEKKNLGRITSKVELELKIKAGAKASGTMLMVSRGRKNLGSQVEGEVELKEKPSPGLKNHGKTGAEKEMEMVRKSHGRRSHGREVEVTEKISLGKKNHGVEAL